MGPAMYLRIVLLSVLALGLTTCSGPRKHLKPAEAASCRANGGYESSSAFGFPICQHRYSDAGKTCDGKANCLGRCLFEHSGSGPFPKAGDTASGKCQPTSYYPGCYAEVEGGKLQDDGLCED